MAVKIPATRLLRAPRLLIAVGSQISIPYAPQANERFRVKKIQTFRSWRNASPEAALVPGTKFSTGNGGTSLSLDHLACEGRSSTAHHHMAANAIGKRP